MSWLVNLAARGLNQNKPWAAKWKMQKRLMGTISKPIMAKVTGGESRVRMFWNLFLPRSQRVARSCPLMYHRTQSATSSRPKIAATAYAVMSLKMEQSMISSHPGRFPALARHSRSLTQHRSWFSAWSVMTTKSTFGVLAAYLRNYWCERHSSIRIRETREMMQQTLQIPKTKLKITYSTCKIQISFIH